MSLPEWLRDKLASPPDAGAGIHAWLFSCARQLHAHMPTEAIGAVLSAATAGAGRRVTGREIRDAVNNSLACAWVPGGGAKSGGREIDRGAGRRVGVGLAAPGSIAQERWPKPDDATREMRIRAAALDGVTALVDLWEWSPVRPDWTADDWLDWLFPDAEWLCLASDHPATARSRRREKWSFGPADECGLVVPSPMTGPSGKGLDGRTSHRCLDNTTARRWLVIEFDSGSLDEQAAIHWHLRAAARAAGWPGLALCVHSGGKSLHGWYGPVTTEDAAHELMSYAVSLGADPATWNRCQLVRLPGGRRVMPPSDPVSLPEGFEPPGAFIRQKVFFFNPTPTPCPQPSISNSSARGAQSASSQPPVSMAA